MKGVGWELVSSVLKRTDTSALIHGAVVGVQKPTPQVQVLLEKLLTNVENAGNQDSKDVKTTNSLRVSLIGHLIQTNAYINDTNVVQGCFQAQLQANALQDGPPIAPTVLDLSKTLEEEGLRATRPKGWISVQGRELLLITCYCVVEGHLASIQQIQQSA